MKNEHYLYFADGNGANLAGEAAMFPVSRFRSVEPLTATTTGIWFESGIGHAAAGGGDLVTVTHADTHDTASSYHRAKLIAEAMVEACNAGPHAAGSVISVIDMDTGNHFGAIDTIKGDASFGIVTTLDS